MRIKNKKSIGFTWGFIIAGLLALIIFIFLSVMNTGLLRKSATSADELIGGDYDGDGIGDFFDKCACHDGPEDKDGCPPQFQNPTGYPQGPGSEGERCKNERRDSIQVN